MKTRFETEAKSNSETIITLQIYRSNHYEGKKGKWINQRPEGEGGEKGKAGLTIASVEKLNEPSVCLTSW